MDIMELRKKLYTVMILKSRVSEEHFQKSLDAVYKVACEQNMEEVFNQLCTIIGVTYKQSDN